MSNEPITSDTLSPSCCERAPDEQLFGTAARAKIWFALEYREMFGADAILQSGIPDAVKKHLDSVPNSRVQLIRKPEAQRNGALAFFIARPREQNPLLYTFDLASYDELLQLDLFAVIAGDPKFEQNRSTIPLLLVCANGKRDRACAKFGLPIYNTARQTLNTCHDEQIWQTTHLGGHRFAGTAIALPRGISYGHLRVDNAPYTLIEFEAGRIVLENYRGAAFYGEVEQVAEYYLRTMTGIREFGAFHLLHVEPIASDQWIVRFEGQNGEGRGVYEVKLVRDLSIETYKNSSDVSPTLVPQFRMLDITERKI